ncbi:MAG: DUF1624 domain-containing protein [Opitutus sp.]|nr:DUF1624 domain-containing protein [Opitutus sp.]
MSASTPPAPGAATPPSESSRLVSLDALRGFDMFWILGADAVVHTLPKIADIAPVRLLNEQMEHKAWAGFGFYDLIFPLFVFIVGVSLVFSITRSIGNRGRIETAKHVLVRTAVLFLLGLFYSGGMTNPWPDLRLLGVLQRIALAYGATGLLFCFFQTRVLANVTAAILVGYWALLTFVPIRPVHLERQALPAQMGAAAPTLVQARAFYQATTDRVTGGYEPGINLTNQLDFEYLPGRLYDVYWDPEGLLSTLPAVASCLLGVFAGILLRRSDRTSGQKITWLVAGGLSALVIGHLWGLQFPVVKKLWSSTFVLVAGGWSLLLLAAFYYLVDVRQWRRWCLPFVWIGMNPITLYVVNNLVNFRRNIAPRLGGGSVKNFFDSAVAAGSGDLVIALIGLALLLWLARFLYEQKIFLRV